MPLTAVSSKFFIFVLSINFIGLGLAASGKWTYARHYSGGCVLGNLLVATLMRNELFGRLLYLIVNTLFAKVSFHLTYTLYTMLTSSSVDSSRISSSLYFCTSASWRYPFWIRDIGIYLVAISPGHHLHQCQEQPPECIGHGRHNVCRLGRLYYVGPSLGAEQSSQVSQLR
jgi:hypothetical protein